MGSEIKDIIESLRAEGRIEIELKILDEDGNTKIESVTFNDDLIKLTKKP